IAGFTEQVYGRRSVPRAAMLRALNVVRHIRYLQPDPRAIIFEIGPGSGYLGALLLELGYRYAATDVTQGMYIWQNHLLNAMVPGQVAELATADGDFFSGLGDARAIHVPWWKFVVVEPVIRSRVDVVTCNHALCEMHPSALAYSLRASYHLLEGGAR